MEKTIFSQQGRKRLSVALIAALALSLMAFAFQGNATGAFAAETVVEVIQNHDTWQYEDTDTDMFGDPTTDFRSKDYDDSAWASGPSPLGYPAAEKSGAFFGQVSGGGTLMNSRANPDAIITYYLRKDFTLENIAAITALSARLSIDDGFVMYLNGQEIARLNMPDGATSHSTAAGDTWEISEERANPTLDLTAYIQYLVEGENTLAVDLHNRDAKSSDIYWGMSLTATYEEAAPPTDVNKTPKQVNVHMGDDPSSEVNVTYTTVASDDTKIVIERADGEGDALEFEGEASPGSGGNTGQNGKYVHKIAVTGLKADTDYEYKVGNEVLFEGAFKTAPAKGDDDPIRFIYLADTQVSSDTNAKALGATLETVASMEPDFVYLAGDITDTANSESQWEQMFYNSGTYPTGGETMFRNYLISAIQGNHDNNTFNRHINAPTLDSGGVENRIVYSYDYGPLTFIGLNLETARSDATARDEQEKFLRAAVADAKARGQWTAVGFHKSLVTGASHVVDSDVIDARKFWTPKFAELDVDMVLQGHDHVYSRGFVDAAGYPADRIVNDDGSIVKPLNAPLYMVGGHAGGLKWYALKNYTVSTGDPIAPGYTFLDVNSANPAHNTDGIPSNTKQEQVIVQMDVSEDEVEVNTYMFKYDTTSDTVTTPMYRYDTMTMERRDAGAGITGPELSVADTGDEITYTVSYNGITDANAFDTTVAYDSDVLEFIEAESVETDGNEVLVNQKSSDPDDGDGQARLITGLKNAVSGERDVARFTFKAKQPVTADDATVTLVRANTVNATIKDGKLTESTDVEAVIANGTATTTFYKYSDASDVNGDGHVTLADLSLTLGRYQSDDSDDRTYDIDLSGVVDTLDFVIISSFMK
jgi:hypothetical protein